MQNPKFKPKPVAVGVANENVASVGDIDPVGEVSDALAPENRIHSTDDQERTVLLVSRTMMNSNQR